MTTLAKLRRNLLADPDLKAEYERLGSIFEVVAKMVDARLTQADIAARMGTTKSVIARLEAARHSPAPGLVARSVAANDCR